MTASTAESYAAELDEAVRAVRSCADTRLNGYHDIDAAIDQLLTVSGKEIRQAAERGWEASFRFTVPLPPSALRPNRRSKLHWAPGSRAAVEYSEAICYAPITDPLIGVPWKRAEVTYTWRYSGTQPDIDNIAGAIKVLQDTLCEAPANASPKRWYLGIVANDRGIEAATFRREKVAHRHLEGVLVTVRRVE